jgi:hypothetical protein
MPGAQVPLDPGACLEIAGATRHFEEACHADFTTE